MNLKHSTSFTVYPEMCNFYEEGKMLHGGYALMMMDRCAAECSRRLLYDAVSQKYKPTKEEEGYTQAIKLESNLTDVEFERMYQNTINKFSLTANSAVTVNVTDVTFFVGAMLGDIIFLNAEVVKLGNKRIDIQITGERENSKGEREKICEGKFVFVSMYNNKSVPHGLTLEKK